MAPGPEETHEAIANQDEAGELEDALKNQFLFHEVGPTYDNNRNPKFETRKTRRSAQAQRRERGLIESGGGDEAVVALEIGKRLAGERAHQPVDFAFVITLLLQRGLTIGHHLIEGPRGIADVDRTVVWIVGGCFVVAPGGIPVTGIPIIPAASDEKEVTGIARLPPTLVVPLRAIRGEALILRPAPILGAGDLIVLIALTVALDELGFALKLAC
jgi:hypothetical protein